jgi:hypothetical protein
LPLKKEVGHSDVSEIFWLILREFATSESQEKHLFRTISNDLTKLLHSLSLYFVGGIRSTFPRFDSSPISFAVSRDSRAQGAAQVVKNQV